MTDVTVNQPTTEQLIAAFAAALLPFAGPVGVAAGAVVPALEQMLSMFRNQSPEANYTVEQLVAIVASGNTSLAKLASDIDAMPDPATPPKA